MNKHKDYLYQALDIESLVNQLAEDEHVWAQTLGSQTRALLAQLNHGNLADWLAQLQNAPSFEVSTFDLNAAAITLKTSSDQAPSTQAQLHNTLENLKPWRKGPFHLFDIDIDSEWRSDLKWSRLAARLDLKNKAVLDVGCANGYFGWRILGAGAKSVVGIDPGLLFIIQFLLVRQYAASLNKQINHWVLPYRLEDLPRNLNYFDTVFSMGVLYHRRSVFDHLYELKQCLKPGGQLVLETLVITAEQGEVLVPKDRYARMRNVWFIPNSAILCAWLARVGFVDMQIIDESSTSIDEQRKTGWINSQSLEQCLDPNDPSRTIEGYPAPRRAIIIANKPA